MSFQSIVRQRRVLVFSTLVLIAILMASTAFASLPTKQDAPLDRLQEQADGSVRVEIYPPTRVARWIDSSQSALTREFAGQTPEAAARAFMGAYGSLMGVTDQGAQLKLESVKSDALGMQHVRFSQIQNGLPVFGADLIVHINADGSIASVNGYVVPNAVAVDTVAKLSEKQAAEVALESVGLADGTVTESSLVVLNPGIVTDQASGTYLTYRIHVDSATQSYLAQWVFVDAQTADVRLAYASHPEARNRNTYNMQHGTSYASAILTRTEGQGPVTSATNCTTADINNAHDYTGDTYNFYFDRFGRDSYNNAGAALNSYVCYGTGFQNAYWDGSKMTYGDGFATADDVVAHELSHGVTEYASGLVYSNQSGALNESYSDIFGESVDLTNTGGTDTEAVRWDCGEDIPGFGASRDMMDPTRFNQPDRTDSSYYYCGTLDYGGVHTNSGVPNKAYALMVDGGVFNGYTIAGVGIDAASAVEYRTNEYKLTTLSKFYDNYLALLQSCDELYGGSSATCVNIKKATEAVKMNSPVCGAGGGPTATPVGGGPTATPTPTAGPGGQLINGGFESGPNVGWSEYSALGFPLVTSGTSHGGTWRAWLGGADGEVSEITQVITVPSEGGTLSYWYWRYSTDICGYDFGYVKIDNTTLRTHDLCSSNNSSTWGQDSISLAAYAGQTVTLKFRATTDVSAASSLLIDDVSLESPTGTATPTATATPTIPGIPSVSDPVDPGVVHDITALQAGISDDLLTVQITERNNFQDNANTWIWVDSDQNPDTGDARYAHLGGADYMIECYTLPPVVYCRVADLPTLPTTDTETWTDFTEIPGASVSLAGNILSFQLPVSVLGTPAAVDLFAGTFKGFVALDDRVADGDRCPDAGALDTATGSVVVRRPIAHPIDITFPDIIGDSTGGADLDITSARLRTFGDQLEITLSFARPINYTSFAYELEGRLVLDTDHSIFTGFQGMGNGIQTWGGDVLLSYSISKLSRDFTLQYFQGQSTMYTRLQPRYNDGRYRISGNQLILTASASLFDARIQTSELLQGQWHDAWIRQPVSGNMLGHLATRHSNLYADVLPENGGALDTVTGQAIAPLAWYPDLTVTATDPQGDVGTSTGTDLIRIDSEVVDQNLVLKTTLTRWDITDINHAFAAFLDTDMNADTGWVLQNNLNAPYAAVGADYTVSVLPVLTTGLVVYPTTLYRAEPEIRFHNLDALTYARPGPGNNYFTITIPLSAIGNPPELRLFVKSFMNGIPVVDVAPVYPMIIAYRNDHVSLAGLGYQPGGMINGNPGFPYLQAQPLMESTTLNLRARTYANDITAATLFWTTNPAASSQSDWTTTPMSRELPGPGGAYDSWSGSVTAPNNSMIYYKIRIVDGADERWIVRAGEDETVADASTTWTINSTALSYGSATAVHQIPAGWTLLGLTVVTTPNQHAEDALDQIAAQGGNATEIYRWFNGAWDAHVHDLPFNDFELEMGKGYFVRATTPSAWQRTGLPQTTPLALPLTAGWNLVNFPWLPAGGLDAETALDQMEAQGGLCSEMDRWLSGGWDAHIHNLPFNSFPLRADEAYFVKCSQSSTYVPQ